MIDVDVLNRFTLNGTIDPHDPLGVTFRITGGERAFRLTVVTVNWGRGYDPGVFRRNVVRLLDRVDSLNYVALLVQELDEEPDPAREHRVLRSELGPDWEVVEWSTREPILLSPGIDDVRRKRRTLLMGSGQDIGGPEGTGPARYFVSCIIRLHGVDIGLGNQHPHRSSIEHPRVQQALRDGQVIAAHQVVHLVGQADVVIWGGDVNDENYPALHPREREVMHRRLDTVRLIDKRG